MTKTKQESNVKEYFDHDSSKYTDDRYPKEAVNCDQYSYLTRKAEILRMLDANTSVGSILDIGCGPGIYIKDLLARNWKVNGIDISTGMVDRARLQAASLPNAQNANFSVGVATDLKFDSSCFDAVLCIGVVSYIEDLDRAVSEISRVLKPGGCAFFQISNAISPLELFIRMKRAPSPIVKLLRKPDVDDRLREKIILRPYRAPHFRKICERHGFHTVDGCYYDYRFPVIDRLFKNVSLRLGMKLQRLGRSRALGWLGSSYLVVMQKNQH
jgi:SAM-dependent methyltransferase